MRRWIHSRIGLGLLIALAGTLAVVAQTPAQDDDPLAGVTVETVGNVAPADNPGQALVLLRLTLEPGVTIVEHGHPGAVVLFVVSGEFGTTFTAGAGHVTRVGAEGTPAADEPIEVGRDLVLEAGDAVSYDQDSHHVMRNLGSEPLVLLATGILASDQPGFIFVETSA